MKTVATVMLTTLLALLPWCSANLLAQQTAPAGSDKKIVITKRITDASGAETTETIIKKGKSAENFDAEAYLEENEADNVSIRIREESDNGRNIRITTSEEDEDAILRDVEGEGNGLGNGEDEVDWDEINETVKKACAEAGKQVKCLVIGNDDSHGFLGVQQDSDEDANVDGITVEIVRGSAAEKAGLKNNDILLKLNDTPINRWSDLTAFMAKTKPGDQINVAYSRLGTPASVSATLTKHSEVQKIQCDKEMKGEMQHGFLGVSPEASDEKGGGKAAGVPVNIVKESGAEKAGLTKGDRIVKLNDSPVSDWEDVQDFMGDTKSGEKVKVTYERNGQTQTTEATLGQPKDEAPANWNWNWNGDRTLINSREKEACLGVYSGAYGEQDKAGSKVYDFTEESAAREKDMHVGDVITQVNTTRITSHDELWNEIARYKPGETVKVDFLRDDQPMTVQATLKACRDRKQVSIVGEEGEKELRRFYLWKFDQPDQERLRTRRVITIHRAGKSEGDAPKTEAPTQNQPSAEERTLQIEGFRAYPNPTSGQITVEFHAQAVPTDLALLDISGRQLFSEELNAFNGDYNQQFDLSEYAKGTIILRIRQGDKVFTVQIVVN